MYFQPADPNLEIDPAIDASLLSSEILGLYHAFRTPLKFSPDELLPEYRNQRAALQLDQEIENPIDPSDLRQGIGSNNWVVSGKLTVSGYPMMMNDPHRDLSAPSLALLGASGSARLECDRRR